MGEQVPPAAAIRPIAEPDAYADFRTTRQPELAEFLRDRAWPNDQRGFGRTFVLPGKASTPLLGYYTLSMSRAEERHFPAELRNFPFRTIPAALLGNIARDDRAAPGTGQLLMVDALQRVVQAAEHVACYGVMLYAKNDGLMQYYRRGYGFLPLELKPTMNNPSQLMFLPLRDVRETLEPH